MQQASLAAAAVVQQAMHAQQAAAAVVQQATAVVGAVLRQQAAKFAHATAVDVVQQPMHAQKGPTLPVCWHPGPPIPCPSTAMACSGQVRGFLHLPDIPPGPANCLSLI